MKLILNPLHRFHIKELIDQNNGRFCLGEELINFNIDLDLSLPTKTKILLDLNKVLDPDYVEKTKPIYESLQSETNPFRFFMKSGHLLSYSKIVKRKELTLEQIKEGAFLIDTYSEEEKSTINLGLACIQEIMQSKSASECFKKMETLLS
jgi:hypothetical protein